MLRLRWTGTITIALIGGVLPVVTVTWCWWSPIAVTQSPHRNTKNSCFLPSAQFYTTKISERPGSILDLGNPDVFFLSLSFDPKTRGFDQARPYQNREHHLAGVLLVVGLSIQLLLGQKPRFAGHMWRPHYWLLLGPWTRNFRFLFYLVVWLQKIPTIWDLFYLFCSPWKIDHKKIGDPFSKTKQAFLLYVTFGRIQMRPASVWWSLSCALTGRPWRKTPNAELRWTWTAENGELYIEITGPWSFVRSAKQRSHPKNVKRKLFTAASVWFQSPWWTYETPVWSGLSVSGETPHISVETNLQAPCGEPEIHQPTLWSPIGGAEDGRTIETAGGLFFWYFLKRARNLTHQDWRLLDVVVVVFFFFIFVGTSSGARMLDC